jgi:hypothetical protein
VQLEEIQETLETVSAPTEDPRDVQDVAQTVVEAPPHEGQYGHVAQLTSSTSLLRRSAMYY